MRTVVRRCGRSKSVGQLLALPCTVPLMQSLMRDLMCPLCRERVVQGKALPSREVGQGGLIMGRSAVQY